jgi:hypothetical protein
MRVGDVQVSARRLMVPGLSVVVMMSRARSIDRVNISPRLVGGAVCCFDQAEMNTV